MQHSSLCIADYEQITQARAEWAAAHPGYCMTCDGWGGFTIPGTREDPPEFDVCEDCIGKGLCPHCGKKLDNKLGEHADLLCCLSCGWSEEKDSEGAPGPFVCGCDYFWQNQCAPDEHLESSFEEQFENAEFEKADEWYGYDGGDE